MSERKPSVYGIDEATKAPLAAELPAKWASIDVETGGLNCIRDALLSVAVWTPEDGAETVYLRPDGDVEPTALAINHIDLADCAHGCTAPWVARWLVGKLRGRVIVGHNLAFDLAFIAWKLFRLPPCGESGTLLDILPLQDTYRLAQARWPEECHSLTHTAELCGIDVDEKKLHNAGYDAELTARVYRWMVEHPAEDRQK